MTQGRCTTFCSPSRTTSVHCIAGLFIEILSVVHLCTCNSPTTDKNYLPTVKFTIHSISRCTHRQSHSFPIEPVQRTPALLLCSPRPGESVTYPHSLISRALHQSFRSSSSTHIHSHVSERGIQAFRRARPRRHGQRWQGRRQVGRHCRDHRPQPCLDRWSQQRCPPSGGQLRRHHPHPLRRQGSPTLRRLKGRRQAVREGRRPGQVGGFLLGQEACRSQASCRAHRL